MAVRSGRRPNVKAGLFLAVVAVSASACGGPSDPAPTIAAPGGSTIDIAMVDVGFRPTALSVARGATVRFRFTNTGHLTHDAFIGDAAAQDAHEAEMAAMGSMDHGGEADAITVRPGSTATLVHAFDQTGQTIIGCHQPGHFAAGMRVTVTVI